MQAVVIHFALGVLAGGLILSGCWGLFWAVIGSIGLARRTCSWRALFNSLAVGAVPLSIAAGLMWMKGGGADPAFAVGLTIVPLVLMGFGLRHAPDGQRAGMHMVAGVRGLMDDLLGRHQACGGCGHQHDHDPGGHR